MRTNLIKLRSCAIFSWLGFLVTLRSINIISSFSIGYFENKKRSHLLIHGV